MFFLQAEVDYRLSQVCYNTLSFFGKNIPRLSFCFCLVDGSDVVEGHDARDTLRGSSEQNFPMSADVSQAFNKLTIIDGVDIRKISNGSSCIGMLSFAVRHDRASVIGAGDIGVNTLEGFIGRFKSVRPLEIFGCCLP